jgi:hypothetical protein
MALGFIPGVGPLLSGAASAIGGMSWKVWAGFAAAIAAAVLAWKADGYVARANADHLAVAALTAQVATATAAANQNAAALKAAEAQHAAVIASATAATAAASARADTLNRKLEALRHAPRSVCTPSATARSLLDGLRK